MGEPLVIVGGDYGEHNRSVRKSGQRVKDGKAYRDLSTVCVIPTRGVIPAMSVERWMGLLTPMNQPFVRLFVSGMEVGAAYEHALDIILSHDGLQAFRYMLTLEEDNLPPPDGLLRLYESIDDYQVVAGLYWTKGEGGMPMIYGDPKTLLGFQPQVPRPGVVQETNGVGMGFTLFDLSMFRDGKIDRPFFKTVQEWTRETGAAAGTQDLHFCAKARKAGYRIASDNRVRVGHLDTSTGHVW